jgi:hypothetical protein
MEEAKILRKKRCRSRTDAKLSRASLSKLALLPLPADASTGHRTGGPPAVATQVKSLDDPSVQKRSLPFS